MEGRCIHNHWKHAKSPQNIESRPGALKCWATKKPPPSSTATENNLTLSTTEKIWVKNAMKPFQMRKFCANLRKWKYIVWKLGTFSCQVTVKRRGKFWIPFFAWKSCFFPPEYKMPPIQRPPRGPWNFSPNIKPGGFYIWVFYYKNDCINAWAQHYFHFSSLFSLCKETLNHSHLPQQKGVCFT